MNRIFNLDNGFFRALSKFVDCIYLSLLFIISCIPLFTIGAALTALYYTVQKVLRNDRGYVGSEYWHAFKTNFKQATIIWLIVAVVGIIMSLDIQILDAMDEAGHAIGKTSIFFRVMMILEVVWCIYLFPYMARFINTNKIIMKNAAFIAILNLPRTILLGLLLLVFGLIVYIFPIAIFIVPALYTWVSNRILEKIFRKYMSEEDKAAEDEMNREYKN